MAIELRRNPNDRLLELGGGANPCVHPECMGGRDVNIDVRMAHTPDGRQAVDIEWPLENTPLPIGDSDFDGVVSIFALEHVSWRKVPDVIAEMFRVVKPGGKCVVVVPNTEEQIRRILSGHPDQHKDGPFIESSRLLYGDQDYQANSHSSFFSPRLATYLFSQAGFENISITPYGELNTDMVVQCKRPLASPGTNGTPTPAEAATLPAQPAQTPPMPESPPQAAVIAEPQLNNSTLTSEERAALFGKAYFNGGYYTPWHWDEPRNETMARHVLLRKPESVLELGCSKGFLLKRLQDARVRAVGLDISKHCHMARVAEDIQVRDAAQTPWPPPSYGRLQEFDNTDLCLSVDFLDRIPEELVPVVASEMKRTCKRGLHAIMLKSPTADPTRCTVKDKAWWVKMLPQGHEIIDYHEFVAGPPPADYLAGDGKLKLNVGCYMTMFHHGWTNVDKEDCAGFAGQFQYKFERWDVRNGLPYKTGVVDMIYASHMLEHLTYDEGERFLKECRRVIKPGGYMRLIVPDAALLYGLYTDRDGVGLEAYDEVNDGCAAARTQAQKLWSLVHEGHSACYDYGTLHAMLEAAGWVYGQASFRQSSCKQMLDETLDLLPCLSLYADATPKIA